MKFITTKLLSYVSGGLLVALAIAIGFGWIQSDRLDSARQTIETQKELISSRNQRINEDAARIQKRDALIAEQNKAVLQMAERAEADHADYLARLAEQRRKNEVLKTQVQKVQAYQPSNPDDALVTQSEVLGIIRDSIREYQKGQANDGR